MRPAPGPFGAMASGHRRNSAKPGQAQDRPGTGSIITFTGRGSPRASSLDHLVGAERHRRTVEALPPACARLQRYSRKRRPHGCSRSQIGPADAFSIEEARTRARDVLTRVHAGLPAFEAPPVKPASFEHVAEQWLARHVRAKGLRSESEVTRLLKARVFPAWKDRPFLSIRRSDVAALLDSVEDEHGAKQADYVLSAVRGIMSIMNWYATRHDDYMPPLV